MGNVYEEKRTLMSNAANHVDTHQMPIASMAQTWAIAYANSTLDECLTSLDKEIEVYGKHLLDMDFDSVFIFGVNRPLNAYKHLGFAPYFASPDGVTLQAADNTAILQDDEIERFTRDPSAFFREVAIARRYPALQQDSPKDLEAMKAAAKDLMAWLQAGKKRDKALKKVYQTPALASGIPTSPPFDQYLCYRGFQKAIVDLRRRPEQVKEACEALVPFFTATEKSYPDFPWVMNPVVGATYLNPKQFEEIFWPTYKKVLDSYIEKGGKILVALEGKWGKEKYRFFNDFPANSIICFLEDDDPFEAKEIIGDRCAISYPFPVALLKHGSKEEVIEHAKQAIDKIGTTGVFFATDKCLMSPGDVNPENYRALAEFCHEYHV